MNSKFKMLMFGLLFVLGIQAQTSDENIVLTNYAIPLNAKGVKIADFKSTSGGMLKISDDPSGFFEVKNNELYLKKNKEVTKDSPMIFPIQIKDGDMVKSFELVKDEFIKNKVIAHRGAWKHHDVSHNTIGSISAGINIGCEASEIDVWLTKDKKIILCHDMDLDGKIVEKTNLKDLREVKLKKEESAPTLEEILDILKKQNKMRLVIELKSNSSNSNVIALAESVLNLVHKMNAQAWVDYISFDYRGLTKIRSLDATAHLSLLDPSVPLDLQKLDGMTGIDYYYTLFDKDKLFERCKILGLTTNAWTVNDEGTMKKLLDNNIDFITTDEPELLLKVISESK